MSFLRRNLLLGSLALAAVGSCPQKALAQTFGWAVDGGGSWITDTNWTPVVPGEWPKDPADIANLTFNLTGAAAITLDAAITVGALTIGDTNATHTYTLSDGAGGSLNFDNSGSAATLTQSATGLSDVISATMTTAGDLNIVNLNTASGRTFTLGGPLSSSAVAGTQLLTFNQSNTNAAVLMSGAISNGLTGGTIALTKTGSGTLTLSVANTYTGATTLTGGNLQLRDAGSIQNSALSLNGGTLQLRTNAATTFTAASATLDANSTINVDRIATSTGITLTFNPTITVTGNRTLSFTSGNSYTLTLGNFVLNGDLTLNASATARPQSISEDASPRKVIKTGTGLVVMQAASTYSGGTDILNGPLQFNVTGGAGLTTGLIQVGDTSGTNVAEIRVAAGATIANDITVRSGSSGTMKISRDSGATAGTGAYSGLITLQKATTFENASSNATAGNSILDITGKITGTGHKITVTRGSTSHVVQFSNAANDFGFAGATSDAITIAGGVLRAASDAALGMAGNDITLTATTASFSAAASFNTARIFTFNAAGALEVTTGSELTLTTDGGLLGAAGFSKTGGGILTILANNSARTTGTTLSAGTLRLESSDVIGTASALTLGGGILDLRNDSATVFTNNITTTGSATINADRAVGGAGDGLTHTVGTLSTGAHTITFTSANNYGVTTGVATSTGSLTLTSNLAGTGLLTVPSIMQSNAAAATLTLRGTGSTIVTGAITQGGAGLVNLTKNDASTVTLGAASNHTGATTITNGTLRFTLSNQVASSTGIAVGATSTLDLRGDTPITNTVPIAFSSSSAVLNVDRAVGGAGVGQTHVVGDLSVTNTTTPTITGANGYGLMGGTFSFVDSAGLRNDAPGLVTLAGVTVNNAAVKTLTLRGTGSTVLTTGINQAGLGAYNVTKLDAGPLTINGASNYTGNTAVGNTTTVGGVVTIGVAGAIPNTGVSILSGTLDMNGFDLTPTSLSMGDGPTLTSANLLMNGGTLILGGNVAYVTEAGHLGAFITGNVSLGGATRTFTIADTGGLEPDMTINGPISDGVGGIAKSGSGSLLLGGTTANTYAGPTSFNQGFLLLGKPDGVNAIPGDLAFGVTGGSGSSFLKNMANEQIGNTATVNLKGVSGIGGQSWDLNDFNETIAVLNMDNDQGAGGLLVGSGLGTLTVNGTITIDGSSPATNSNTISSGTFTGNHIAGNLSLGSATRIIDVIATGNATISAAISSGGITKTGARNLILSGANTYTLGTEVQAGLVDVRNISGLGTAGVNLNGGTLTLRQDGDGAATPETFNFGNAVTVSADTTITADRISGVATTKTLTVPSMTLSGQTVTITANNSFTFGVLGAVSLTASPTFNVTAGTFALSGGATDGGGGFGITKLGAGTMSFDAASPLKFLTVNGGTVAGTGTITLSDDLTPLTLRNNTVSANVTLTGATGAAITFDATSNGIGTISGALNLGAVLRSFAVGDGTSGPDLHVTGAIAGTMGWNKDGAGHLRLGGTDPNTYTGPVSLNGGILSLNKPDGVTAINGNLDISGTVKFLASDQIADTANVTITTGNLHFHNDGTSNRSETIASLTSNGGQMRTVAGTATVASLLTITGAAIFNAGEFQVNSGSSISVGSLKLLGGVNHVIGGNSALQVNELAVGAGGLEFTGVNLQMNKGSDGTRLGSRLNLGGDVVSNAAASEAGLFGATTGDANGIREISLGASTRTFTVADGAALNDLRVDFPIVGAGGLTKAGIGTLALAGANTFDGNTTVNDGVLRLTAAGVIPDGAGKGNVALGALGTLNVNGFAETINGLSGAGTVDNTAGGAATLMVGANDATSAFGGTIQNTGGALTVEKIGTGTLALNGMQNYSTLTTTAGTTNVNGSFTNGTSVVNANATTNFSANQTLGALNIGAGAVVTFTSVVPPFAGDGGKLTAGVVPEPGSIGLLLVGALGILSRRRRPATPVC